MAKRVEVNDNLPPSLPRKIALLYQLRQYIDKDLPEMTVFYLNKHLNAKKLSAHLWFFEGFCKLLIP